MGGGGGLREWVRPIAVLAAGVGVAVIAVAVLRADHVPASDWATIESRVRDVGTRWTPTEGAWSRYGWNHPGPLAFYFLALVYRVGGGDPAFLRLGALMAGMTAVALVVVLLGRAGRMATAIGLLCMALSLWALPRSFFTDYWNPSLAVGFVGVVLLAAWGCLDGWAPALPILVVAWSWCMQAHVSYGTVVLPAAAVGFAVMTLRARRDPGLRRLVLASAIVGAALWLPAAVDTIRDPPGNLVDISRWALEGSEPTAGFDDAASFLGIATDVGHALWQPFPLFVEVADLTKSTAVPGGLVVLLVVAGAVALRTGLRSEANLIGLCLLTWVCGFVAVSQVAGPLLYWIVWWVHPLAACSWLGIGLVVARLIVRVAPRANRYGVVAGVGAVTLAAVSLGGSLVGALRDKFYWEELDRPISLFTDAAVAWVPAEPVLVEFTGDPSTGGAVQAGLMVGLKRHGVDTVVSNEFEPQFGRRHARSDPPAEPALLVRSERIIADTPPGYEELAVSDPLSEAERVELGDLIDRMTAVFVDADWTSRLPLLESKQAALAVFGAPPAVVAEQEALERIGELNDRGVRLVLFGRLTPP